MWIIFRFRFWINLHNWCVTEVQETLIKWHLEWISAAGWHLGNWSRHWNALEFRDLNLKFLFLDADDKTLVKRYKETRRSHPLSGKGRVDEGIRKEREYLKFLRKSADYILDTSQLLTRELKAELEKIFVDNQSFQNMIITVLSFGFKYGIPEDADLVFDASFPSESVHIEELRPQTGNNPSVRDYVMRSELSTHIFRQAGKI